MYVSLGKDCSIAYHLQRLGLRVTSLPFDWLLTKNMVDILENEFIDLFNPKYLKFGKITQNFCHIDEDFVNDTEEMLRVKNTKYNIQFLHDFKKADDLPIVKEKYERRILRFLTLMRDQNVYKKLFRIGNTKEIEDLEAIFQNLNFKNYELIHISDFSSTTWKREDFDWSSLFLNFK